MAEKEEDRALEPEEVNDCQETVSSEHSKAAALMSSEQLQYHAKDLCEPKQDHGEGVPQEIPPLAKGLLTVHSGWERKVQFL